MTHNFYDIVFFTLQILVSLYGITLTWKIWKLINHGNAWWLMSVGFLLFIVSTIVRIFTHDAHLLYDQLSTLYLPLIVRCAFVYSVYRIYIASKREVEHRLEAEKKVKSNLKRIKELSAKLDPESICPHWDERKHYCHRQKKYLKEVKR